MSVWVNILVYTVHVVLDETTRHKEEEEKEEAVLHSDS